MMKEETPRLQIRVKPFFKWFDLWIGVYIDTQNQTVYICPLPTIGIKIFWWRETLSDEAKMKGFCEAASYINECIKAGWSVEDAIQSAKKIGTRS